jgi:peptide/nickel transport system substrate-binding protein
MQIARRPMLLLGAAALTAPQARAQPRDALVVGNPVEPPHLDPTTHVAGSIREVVYANLFQGLTLINEQGQPYPALAERWEVSPDNLTYTFHLRRGATFHDGRPMTSADVVFTLDRARGPQSTNANKRFFEPITTVEAAGPLTVRVTLSRPVGSFLTDMGSADAAIVHEATAATNTTNPIGTGPFRFLRWVRGDRVELERFPQYWGEAPRMARVTFRFISDAQAQAAALRSGDVHVFPSFGAPELFEELRRDPGFEVLLGLTEGECILAMNHRRRPLNDLRVRRAVTHALDRQAINEGAVGGYGRLIGTHYPPHYPDALDLTGMYPHDPARARALLREAGVGSGFQARLILPPFPYARRAGELVQAMLAEVGIRTTIQVYQGPQWLSEVFRPPYDYDFTIIAHTEPFDFPNYARPEWYIGYENQAYRDLIERWFRAVDPAERSRLAQQAQRMLAEDCVAGFLFQLPKTGVQRRGLTGMWRNSPVQANDVTRAAWS